MEVVIIERSIILSERLAELLLDSFEDVVIHSVHNYEDFCNYFKKNQSPDLILIDKDIYEEHPDETPEILRRVKESDTCVIVLYNNVVSSLTSGIIKEQGADYVIDLYPEFENIPRIIQKYCRKKGGKQRPV